MKVVFVHQDGKLTGSAFSLMNMILGFQGKIDPHVVLAEDGPYRDLLEHHGIPTSVCSFTRFWTAPGPKWYQINAFKQLRAGLPNPQIRNHILSLKPDVIHLNDKSCMQVGISLHDTGFPIVQHLRSSYFTTHFFLNKWISIYYISRYSDQIISISEDEVDGFDNNSRVKVIFNTVEIEKAENAINQRFSTRKKLGIAENEIVIGFAAGISKMKGAWDFLKMASKLVNRYPNLRLKFLIAGNAPKPQAHKTILQKIGLRETPYEVFKIYSDKINDHLIYLGFQYQILDIISALDVLVIPTHLGAIGRQALEAMAVKTPVVVTSGHTGRSRIVMYEKTGIVVPINDVEALTAAVSRLIENPYLREQLSLNGYEYAKSEFNPVINSRKVLEIYQELTGIPIIENTQHADV